MARKFSNASEIKQGSCTTKSFLSLVTQNGCEPTVSEIDARLKKLTKFSSTASLLVDGLTGCWLLYNLVILTDARKE